MMNLSVSLDHRVVDGFEGASFLQEVRRYLDALGFVGWSRTTRAMSWAAIAEGWADVEHGF